KMEVSAILTTEGLHQFESQHLVQLSKMAQFVTEIGVLSTDAYVENSGAPLDQLVVRGNLTEQALLRMGVRAGIDTYQIAQDQQVADALLFSSERKFSASLRKTKTGYR